LLEFVARVFVVPLSTALRPRRGGSTGFCDALLHRSPTRFSVTRSEVRGHGLGDIPCSAIQFSGSAVLRWVSPGEGIGFVVAPGRRVKQKPNGAARGLSRFSRPCRVPRGLSGAAGLARRSWARARIALPRLELGMAPRGVVSRFAASAFSALSAGPVTWTEPSRKGRAPARPAFGNPSPGAAPDLGEAPKRPAASGVMDATRIHPGCKSPARARGIDRKIAAETAMRA